MEFVASLLLTLEPYLLPISHLAGWAGWLAFLTVIAWGVWHWWEDPRSILRRRWWVLALLVVATPIMVSTLGVRLGLQTMPLPGVPIENSGTVLMLFAALPWVLAAGFLGPLPAVVVGLLDGLVMGLYTTHSPFSPLEIAGLALLFSLAIRQRYRTLFYRVLRHPLGAAVILGVAYSPIFMLTALFAVNGPLATRLDYAITQTWPGILTQWVELLLAGLVGEALSIAIPLWWGCLGPLLPSPSESSLQKRFFQGSLPLLVILTLALTLGDWLVAGSAARHMVEERLSSTARTAAESLPYFMETGQSLIQGLATPDLLDASDDAVSAELAERMRSLRFFRQLAIFDANERLAGQYPGAEEAPLSLTSDELSGIHLALNGVPFQMYTATPALGDQSAQLSFIASIPSGSGTPAGVLIGHTDLVSNPFTQPIVEALDGLREINGQGYLLDENKQVLYPLTSSEVSAYTGDFKGGQPFFEGTRPDGTRSFVYYQETDGSPWSIVMTVPALYTQQVALDIAIPLLAILAGVSLTALVLMRWSLGTITTALRGLSRQANLIMRGELSQPVATRGEDEIGQLAYAFERMRLSLKSRLDELNSLLVVSQGVAAHLEIHDAVRPILEAAMQDGVTLARVVLTNEVALEHRPAGPVVISVGDAAEHFTYMDEPLFSMLRHQNLLAMPTIARMRRFNIPPGEAMPGALIAFSIRHKDVYYGTFWLAYADSHSFEGEEIRFLTTLASQIALAAFSARTYAQAEVGRQRLDAVLASVPEPVLVFDEQTRLLLLNHAALETPGLVKSAVEGQTIAEVIGPPELAQWLTAPLEKQITSLEVQVDNGKSFYASVSAVVTEGQPVGRICILRDITHYKELDQLKSDFVATVSHDLRSPLTLVRGYASMLEMVGDTTEQQKSYVKKITNGVEAMSRLVNNLLDLGRIDAGIGLKIEKVVLQQVVDEVISSLQAQANQKEIQLSQVAGDEGVLAMVEADRALIQQALYNLVENAIKFTPVKGQVKVRMEMKPTAVTLQVVDTGIGIAPLDSPRLFERFYRSGRREAYNQRGTGLGLAIVKSIVDRHNGKVRVESQLGKGSVFSMELPIHQG